MKLSIITINYNNLDGLKKTFISVIGQTYQDFEWIICDGGSNDGSKDFVEKNQEKFSFWCSEPDGGIYQALNKSVHFAHGEYVCFMNSGDAFFANNTLQQVFSAEHNGDILYGDALFVEKNKKYINKYPANLTYSWLMVLTLNHQATFTRRRIFESINFDTKYKYLADRKFWMQCMLAGYKFEYLSITISEYDYNGFSTQNQDKWDAEIIQINDELTPKIFQTDFEHAAFLETSHDLQKAYSIIKEHGPLRKMLHWAISILYWFK